MRFMGIIPLLPALAFIRFHEDRGATRGWRMRINRREIVQGGGCGL